MPNKTFQVDESDMYMIINLLSDPTKMFTKDGNWKRDAKELIHKLELMVFPKPLNKKEKK